MNFLCKSMVSITEYCVVQDWLLIPSNYAGLCCDRAIGWDLFRREPRRCWEAQLTIKLTIKWATVLAIEVIVRVGSRATQFLTQRPDLWDHAVGAVGSDQK